MNGFDISYILSLDRYTSKCFKGFAMSDTYKLPFNNAKWALYIVNTDNSSGPGEHWCVLYFDKDYCEFFDPYGQPPETYGFENLIKRRRCKYLVYNSHQVQNLTSTTCGHHCIFFALHRCRGYSMSDILNLYHSYNTQENDRMVKFFIKNLGLSIS